MTTPPDFDPRFRDQLHALFTWRRDVRQFKPDAVDQGLVEDILAQAALAPAVGLSQPWRFVSVENSGLRRSIRRIVLDCNQDALDDYQGDRAALYASLKLEALDVAPVQLAVFADMATAKGHGLGRRTMPETLCYSAVMAVHTLWLAARAHGLGLGWVSILDPEAVRERLDVPGDWRLVAYLCIGYPQAAGTTPELERAGWERRDPQPPVILRR